MLDLWSSKILIDVLLIIYYFDNQKIFIPFDGFIYILSVSKCSEDLPVNFLIRYHHQLLGPPLPRHSPQTIRPYSLSKRQWSHRHHPPHRRPHSQPAQRYSIWDVAAIMKEIVFHYAYRSWRWCVGGGRFRFWWSPRDTASVAGSKASIRVECQVAPRSPQLSSTFSFHHYHNYDLLKVSVGWRARPWSRRACFVLEVASWCDVVATHSRASRGSLPARFAASKLARRKSFCYFRCSKLWTISTTD